MQTEEMLNERLNYLFKQWADGIITNRELISFVRAIKVPPITLGDVDLNTGLRYTPAAMRK